MEKKLLDQLADGDDISVALRGGAGWLHGSIVWRRDDVVMLRVTEGTIRPETPFAIVLLGDVSAIALPHELEPPTPEARATGFMRHGDGYITVRDPDYDNQEPFNDFSSETVQAVNANTTASKLKISDLLGKKS